MSDPQTPSRLITFYSVLSGLCPLIPIPFVDSIVLTEVKKRMVRDLAEGASCAVTEPQVAVLSGAAHLGPRPGCIVGCLTLGFRLTFMLILRLFKKVVLFLTFKDAVDAASASLHEGMLLHHCFARGLVPTPATELQAESRALRRAIEGACAEVEHRPIDKIIQSSFRASKDVLRQGTALLARDRSRKKADAPIPVEQEQAVLSDLTDALGKQIEAESAYFDDLRARFDARMQANEE